MSRSFASNSERLGTRIIADFTPAVRWNILAPVERRTRSRPGPEEHVRVETGDVVLKGFRGTDVDAIWIEGSLVPDQDLLVLELKAHVVRSPAIQEVALTHPSETGLRQEAGSASGGMTRRLTTGGDVIAVRPVSDDRFEIHREHRHLPSASRTSFGKPCIVFRVQNVELNLTKTFPIPILDAS